MSPAIILDDRIDGVIQQPSGFQKVTVWKVTVWKVLGFYSDVIIRRSRKIVAEFVNQRNFDAAREMKIVTKGPQKSILRVS